MLHNVEPGPGAALHLETLALYADEAHRFDDVTAAWRYEDPLCQRSVAAAHGFDAVGLART